MSGRTAIGPLPVDSPIYRTVRDCGIALPKLGGMCCGLGATEIDLVFRITTAHLYCL